MKPGRRLALAMLAPGLALAAWLVAGGVLLRAALEPEQRAAVDAALGPLVASHGMLALIWWLLRGRAGGLGGAAALMPRTWRRRRGWRTRPGC